MADPDWSLYRSFLAVAEHGSLSAAARAIGSSQPTLGRHIEALEQSLGAALFTRSPGGLRPTDQALMLKPYAEAMAAAAEAIVRTASGEADSDAGVVRVTASEIVGAEVLPPLLTMFRAEHPRTTVELVLSNKQEDLLRREADIAVRMARPTQDALLAKRIGSVRLYMYGHKRYLAARGTPKTVEDLMDHTLIGFDRQPAVNIDTLNAGFGLDITRETFAIRTDSDIAQLALLRSGYGLCPCQPAVADRDLVPVLTDQFFWDLEVWVCMHEDLRATRRMRLMFDHLVNGLASYVAASQLWRMSLVSGE
jgi:DNA-binding transcriptional LysR family regulator